MKQLKTLACEFAFLKVHRDLSIEQPTSTNRNENASTVT